MIDVKQGLRKAYFEALDGQLTYQGNPVTISDEMATLDGSQTLYVLLAGQDGVQNDTQQSFLSQEDIILDIVYKGNARAAKSPVDDVAGQIMAILFPAPGVTGLVDPPGMQILCPRIENSRYLPLSLNSSNTVMRRLLICRQHVNQI